MKIGEFIRNKRKEKKLTLKEMAQKIGLSQTYLSQLELGDRNVSPEILHSISEILEVPYLELMEIAGYLGKNHLENHLNNIRNQIGYEDLTFSLAIKASDFVDIGTKLNINGDTINCTEEELTDFLSEYLYIRNIAQKWLKDFWAYENEQNYVLDRSDTNTVSYFSSVINGLDLEEILNHEIKYKGSILTDEQKEKLLKTLDLIL